MYYVAENIMKKAENVPRDELLSLGTCFGKFTKSGKFKLHITALDYIAPYAKVNGNRHFPTKAFYPAVNHYLLVQGVAKEQWRNDILVWWPCPQSPSLQNDRRYS